MDILKLGVDFDTLNIGSQSSCQHASSSPVVSATAPPQQFQNPSALSLSPSSPSSPSDSDQSSRSNSNNNSSGISNSNSSSGDEIENEGNITTSSSSSNSSINYIIQPSFKQNSTHDLTFLIPSTSISPTTSTTTLSTPIDIINNNSNNSSSDIETSHSHSHIHIHSITEQINEYNNIGENEEYRIYAHKSMIQDRSDYFRMLLTNGMRETNQQEITIPNVPVGVFFEILMFLYTSHLRIHNDSLNQIFLVCDQFLLEDGKQICREFIKKLDNEVLEGFLFDDNLTICSELHNLYIDQAVCNSTYFLQMNRVGKLSKDILLRILKSNDVYLKEIDIFMSSMEWIKFNVKEGAEEESCETTLSEIFELIRFPMMEYEHIATKVEPLRVVPERLLLEAYRYLSKPKMYPMEMHLLANHRLQPREKPNPPATPGVDVYSINCPDHQICSTVSWTITNFSSIKTQKHVSNTFEIHGLKWKMWAYPAGEAKHSDSFSVYLEAIRVKEKESYDFLRNTTFFFALVNHSNKTLSKHYPSSPNVLFNYEKSVWGNGLIELKLLYDPSLGYLDNDTVCIQLHILECIAIEG